MIACVTSVLLRLRCCRCWGLVDKNSITPGSDTPVPSKFSAASLLIPTTNQYSIYNTCTRGIWKVLSMVFYLSNRFTNPIMFDIILKNYHSSMLWHKFHGDIIMQTRIISF